MNILRTLHTTLDVAGNTVFAVLVGNFVNSLHREGIHFPILALIVVIAVLLALYIDYAIANRAVLGDLYESGASPLEVWMLSVLITTFRHIILISTAALAIGVYQM